MKSIFGKGIKRTDYEIFKFVSDKDLINLCLTNKYANIVLNENGFWFERYFEKYGKYLKDTETFCLNKNWKMYYIDIKNYLEKPFPYYTSFLALSSGREDILVLLEKITGIENVKEVVSLTGNIYKKYYTRNGEENGIREGNCIEIKLDRESLEIVIPRLKYIKVNSKNKEIESYKNGELLLRDTYINNKKLYTEFYKNGTKNKIVKWKNDIKIYEEEIEYKNVKKSAWFVTGEKRYLKNFYDGKKHGTCFNWKRNGEETKTYYHFGKKSLYEKEDTSKLLEEFMKISRYKI